MVLRGVLRTIEGGRLGFWCPGCHCLHQVLANGGPNAWGFNGDYERPTFWPSVLVTGVVPLTEQQWSDYQQGKGLPKPVKSVCHSFVTDGRVQFLADCTHALRGTTVELTAPPAHEASSD